uniref:Peptidase S1 domain-containing protein n=1 Tax=Neogobius melanostomus TaxID=47308 RepID=A0A8C6TPF5_9GOBI
KPTNCGRSRCVPGSWPWQAYLEIPDYNESIYICGGSLINKEWILTASGKRHSGALGCPQSVFLWSRSHLQGVLEWRIHQEYNSTTDENDIALVRMNEPVAYSNYIQPVCLAQNGSTFHTGVKAWVAGWGTLEYILYDFEVSLPVVGPNQCKCNYKPFPIPDKTICAGYAEGQKDSCQGDSGGPLVVKNGSIWIQAGVVSFGHVCARPNPPSVYTEVSEFQDWIENESDVLIPYVNTSLKSKPRVMHAFLFPLQMYVKAIAYWVTIWIKLG